MFALMMAEHELLGRLDLTCVRGLEVTIGHQVRALLMRREGTATRRPANGRRTTALRACRRKPTAQAAL